MEILGPYERSQMDGAPSRLPAPPTGPLGTSEPGYHDSRRYGPRRHLPLSQLLGGRHHLVNPGPKTDPRRLLRNARSVRIRWNEWRPCRASGRPLRADGQDLTVSIHAGARQRSAGRRAPCSADRSRIAPRRAGDVRQALVTCSRRAADRPRSRRSGLSLMGYLNCLAFGQARQDRPGIAG